VAAGRRSAYLEAAEAAASLLADARVRARWGEPSALAGMSVGALAAHLARQVVLVPVALAEPRGDAEPVAVDEHYARAAWVGRDAEDEANVAIARTASGESAAGPDATLARVTDTLVVLRTGLAAEPADRQVRPPWLTWALTLDDFLLTRMLEIAVHVDDLAVSIDAPTPDLPVEVTEPVLALLTRLAARRHGAVAVLRALSRRERAPETISAL